MRVVVYTDYTYHLVDGRAYADRAFGLFIARLVEAVEELVVVGRVDPSSSRARYPLGETVRFIELPWYRSQVDFRRAVPAMFASLRRFSRALSDVDGVWLLGPHPLAIAFALLALVRRRRVVLGVRQDTIAYVRSRHPGRPVLVAAARVLDWLFKALSRWCPVVVVGPDIAKQYRRACSVLEITVSLIDEADIVPPHEAESRSIDGELTVLSVGRLEAEKNPLLLAETLRALADGSGRWRLIVCGEGPMREQLADRLRELGVADRAELRGYVPHGDELFELYRNAHAVLHVSWTEGFPQILLEAFAAGAPVVATDVGGVAEATGDAVLTVPPGDPDSAAAALVTIVEDPGTRRRLIAAGHDYVSARTARREVARVAAFLQQGD